MTDERQTNERGGIMILALFMTIFAIGIVVSGSATLKANKAKIDTSFLLTGQVAEFARSGLTEAMNWFRRQPAQPVTVFAPQLDGAADPPIFDTEDPDIGIVREFKITGNVYGRYEVWKKWDADPIPARLALRQQFQVEDVSAQRGSGGPGTTWMIRCVAYVFVKRSTVAAFNQKPNHVIATESLESEFSRMTFTLPGQAAVCCERADAINLGSKSRIDGGVDGVGVYSKSSTGIVAEAVDSYVAGTQDYSSSAMYDASTTYMFGVTDDRLNTMADYHFTNETDFPPKVDAGSMTVLDTATTVHFTNARPLKGYGLVIIRGDVVIDPGSSSFFYGVLYVDGNLTVNAPAQIHGAVVAKGFAASGVADFVDIKYDDWVINYMNTTLANYRTSRAPRRRRGVD